MMKKRSANRFLSLLLAGCLMLGLLPSVPFAKAAEPGQESGTEANLGELTEADYAALGFTNLEVPEEFNPNDGENPHGTENMINLSRILDLGVFETDGYGNTENDHKRITALYVPTDAGLDVEFLGGLSDKNLERNGDYNEFYDNRRVISRTAVAVNLTTIEEDDTKAGVRQATVDMGILYNPDDKGEGSGPYLGFRVFSDSDAKGKNAWSDILNTDGSPLNNRVLYYTNEGTYEFYSEYQAEGFEGLVQMVAGDFDGDGLDEVAYYIPRLNNPAVRVCDLVEDKDGYYLLQNKRTFFLSEFSNNDSTANNKEDAAKRLPLVSLAAGDLDRDSFDELIITASTQMKGLEDGGTEKTYVVDQSVLERNPNQNDYYLSKGFMGDSLYNSHVFYLGMSAQVTEKEGKEPQAMSLHMGSAGCGMADVDGDGHDEVVFAGLASASDGKLYNDGDSFLLRYLKYNIESVEDKNAAKYAMSSGSLVTNAAKSHIDFKNQKYKSLVSVAGAKFDKAGEGETVADVIFVEGSLVKKSASALVDSEYPMTTTQEFAPCADKTVTLDEGEKVHECITQVIGGNFANDAYGREQFAYVNYTRGGGGDVMHSIGVYGADVRAFEKELVKVGTTHGYKETAQIMIWAPELSDKSTRMRYIGKSMSFTDPIVMCILVSPPYFDDLAGMEDYGFQTNSSTTWGTSSSVGGSGGIAIENSIGFMTGLEYEFDVGGVIKTAGVDFEMESGITVTSEAEVSAEITTTVEYSTAGGNTSVGMIVYPVIDYTYETWVPPQKVPDGTPETRIVIINREHNREELAVKAGETIPGHWERVLISAPQEPATSCMDVSIYDEIAARTGLKPIQDNLIFSTPGDLDTYPSSLAHDALGVLLGAAADFVDIFQRTDWNISTNSGNNSVGRSLEVNVGAAFTYSLGSYCNASLVGKVGISKFGATYGISSTVSASASAGTTSTFSGTVMNMPMEAEGYSFYWMFGVWFANFGARVVPVLDYAVKNVNSPPHIARDLRVTGVTTSTARLEWDVKGRYPAYGFEVQRYDKDAKIWNAVGVTKQGRTYVDKGLDPYTEYQYRLVSLGAAEGLRSLPSEQADCRTLYDGPLPSITGPYDCDAPVGGTATLSVAAQPAAGGSASDLRYQWYKLESGVWKAMVNQTGRSLTFTDVSYDLDQTKYRCTVSQYIDGARRPAYSDSAAVTVTKNMPTLTILGPADESLLERGNAETLRAELRTDGTTKRASGYLSLVVEAMDGSGKPYTQPQFIEGQGVVTKQWIPDSPGHYQITARYDGNAYFESVTSDPIDVYVYSATAPYLVLNAPSVMTYGDSSPVSLSSLTKDGTVPASIQKLEAQDTGILQVTDTDTVTAAGAGETTLTATDDTGSSVSVTVTVEKKPVSARTQEQVIARTEPLPRFEITYDTADVEEELQELVTLTPPAADVTKTVGTYPVELTVETGRSETEEPQTRSAAQGLTAQEKVLQNYDLNLEPGSLVVTPRSYPVTLADTYNGTLTAKVKAVDTQVYLPLENGEAAEEFSALQCSAEPKQGFTVDRWLVNGVPADATLISEDGTLLSVSSLEEATTVGVQFKIGYHPVDFGVTAASEDGKDHGTLTAEVAGGAVSSPANVAGASRVAFRALPDDGWTVENWYVNGEAQNVYEKDFAIEQVNAALQVKVKFTKSDSLRVEGKASGDGTVALYDKNGAPLPNPTEVEKNCYVELRATPNPGAALVKWVWTDTGEEAQGNDPVFRLTAVDAAKSLTAIFESRATYRVDYALSGGDGYTISAMLPDHTKVTSGQQVGRGADVTFQVTKDGGGDPDALVEKWEVDGAPAADAHSMTFTLKIEKTTQVTAYLKAIVHHSFSYGVADGLPDDPAKGCFGVLGGSYTVPDGAPVSLAETTEAAPRATMPTVPENTAITLLAQPAAHYRVKGWTVDGVPVPQGSGALSEQGTGYTIGRLTADTEVTVEFEPDTNALFYSAQGPGQVTGSLAGGAPFESGASLTAGVNVRLTAAARPGYELTGWIVDGKPVLEHGVPFAGTVLDYTVRDGRSEIQAIFQGSYVTVQVTAQGGGTAAITSPAGVADGRVRRGAEITVSATGGPGHPVQAWSVNGAAVSQGDQPFTGTDYTFTLTDELTVNDRVEVAVQFAAGRYTLEFGAASTGGTLTVTVDGLPAVSGEAYAGGAQVVAAAVPDPGWQAVWSIVGTGGQAQQDRLTFALDQDTTIQVTFEQRDSHTLTITAGEGGAFRLHPEDDAETAASVTVFDGDSVTVTALPDDYYLVDRWLVNGAVQEDNGASLTLTPTEDLEVELQFQSAGSALVSYAVDPDDASGSSLSGYVSASADPGPGTAFHSDTQHPMGSRLTFVASPEEGYMVDRWEINGERLEYAGGAYVWDTYTHSSLTGELAVKVYFTAEVTHAVHFGAEPADGGKVEGRVLTGPGTADWQALTDGQAVREGARLAFTVTPAAGHKLEAWQVDGAPQRETSETLTLDGLSRETTVTAMLKDSRGGGGGGGSASVEQPKREIRVHSYSDAVWLTSGGAGDLRTLDGRVHIAVKLEETEDRRNKLTVDMTSGGKAVEQVPGGVWVTFPYDGGTQETVAWLLQSDGSRLVAKSLAAADGMMVYFDRPGTVLIGDNPMAFLDTAKHWGAPEIAFAGSHGLFQGVGGGRFDPNGTMTRGMLVTVLHRLEGEPGAGLLRFDDVDPDAYFAGPVAWAAEQELVVGKGDGFDPSGSITREELAMILFRYAGWLRLPETGRADLDPYADADAVSGWAREAMEWAVDFGLLEGKGEGVLDPRGTATRAEIAAILQRFLKAYSQIGIAVKKA